MGKNTRLGRTAELGIRCELVQRRRRFGHDHGAVSESGDHGSEQVAVHLGAVTMVGEGVGEEEENVVAGGTVVGKSLVVNDTLAAEEGAFDFRGME